jgi:hypothetical protein
MNMYVDEQLVRGRLDDVRAAAARDALIRGLRPVRRPVRVMLGLALIRAGYWIAGWPSGRAGQPRRVTA